MKILVTGAAGFIGFHLSKRLLAEGHEVVGLDNFNDYYAVQLKRDRVATIAGQPGYRMESMDLLDDEGVRGLFKRERFNRVVHLAAQVGVRYSLVNPKAYVKANLDGFFNVMDNCRDLEVEHLVYASSSSVYGLNTRMPFSIHDNVDHPISLYAASKKSNELMAHTYSYLYKLPTTGLRFFTVYGPWGRPDMALFMFTKAILEGQPIKVFNHGQMKRDFTYVDDIVEGIYRVLLRVPEPDQAFSGDAPDPGTSPAPYRIYNIGNHNSVELGRFIETLEQTLGMTARKELLPLQPGDVLATYADISDLERDTGFTPSTSIETGIRRFVDWYREYYKV